MALDLVWLSSFVAVFERGTIAAAAAASGYTAPAVSQHLSKLEANLGVVLFDRTSGRLVPTAAARSLLPIANDIFDLEARGRTAVREPAPVGHVVIAGFASAITTIVTPRLVALDAIATFEIVEAEDRLALRELGLGTMDIALVQEYDHAPIERNRRFTYTTLVDDPLVLVLPHELPAATSIASLADAAWLLNGPGTRCTEAVMRMLARRGISPRVVGHVDDNDALLALVEAGRGVTVVPAAVAERYGRGLTIGEESLDVSRTIYAATRAATAARLAPVVAALSGDPGG